MKTKNDNTNNCIQRKRNKNKLVTKTIQEKTLSEKNMFVNKVQSI